MGRSFFFFAVLGMTALVLTACGGNVAQGGPDAATDVGGSSSGSSSGGGSGSSTSSGGSGSGGGTCLSNRTIEASSYDQACVENIDCIAIGQGSVCDRCVFVCATGAAISSSERARYDDDVARNVPDAGPCFCPHNYLPLCCRQGTCHLGADCLTDGG